MSSTPTAAPSARPRLGRILAWFVLPLFFIVGFPLAYVSALHNPTPHNFPIAVVGPESVTAPIAKSLDKGDDFTITQSAASADARSSVENRDVVGSILISVDSSSADAQQQAKMTVTTYIASGEGRGAASTVQTVGQNVATQLGVTTKVVDVAPLAAKDPLGTNLFYLLIFSSIGGYLVIITISEVWGKSGRARLIGAAITAVVTPPVVFALSSIVVGGYGADAGTIAKLLAVDALYVFTAALASIIAEQLIGPAITMGVILVVVLLNFPSSGGGSPASMLPPFWQGIHDFWFGAGAFESFRSIIYFDGAGAMRWVLQLAAWAFGLLVIIGGIELGRAIRALRHDVRHLAGGGVHEAAHPAAVSRGLPVKTRIVAVIALPAFFITSFVFAYLTALHAPNPNDMHVVVAGDQQVTSQIVAGVKDRADGAFDLTTTTSTTQARSAVEDRSATGAVVIDGTKVTTYVAGGGGRLAASAVESLAGQIATQLDGAVTTVDVAPAYSKDATGTGLFYLLIICTVGGYLTINALWQTFPRARLRVQLALAAGAAIIVPSIVIPLEGLFVGVYGATAGSAWALWGIAALYTFTVGMLATLLTRLLKTASTFGVTVFLLALNFPSSGGAVPASMLPGFWQWVHSFWFGSAGLEAMRGVIYFDGAQVGSHLLTLGIWAAGATAAVLLVRLLQLRKHLPKEPTGDERELVLPGAEAAAASL